MLETLEHYKLDAISAVQVGIPYRMFVMNKEKPKFIFNPRIVDQSKQEVVMKEGGINHLGISVKVSRPYSIKVRYQTETGETTTEVIKDMDSRLYQMMLRSLDGVHFYEDANFLNKNKAIKDLKNFQRKLAKT